MNKCPKCGKEYEGEVCPSCVGNGKNEKTCPHCNATLYAGAKFCPHCGYSFEPEKKNKKEAFLSWLTMHKKHVKIIAAVLVVVLILSIGIPVGIVHRHDGTYYLYDYETETYDYSVYYKLRGKKLYDESGNSVEVEFDGDNFGVYTEFLGEKVAVLTGEVKNDIMKVSALGIKIYAKKNHKHNYTNRDTVIEATCLVEGKELQGCLCGKIKIKRITKLAHEFKDGECALCGTLLLKFQREGEGYSVVGLNDRELTVTEIIIPDIYEGLPVTSIGPSAFSWCSKLKRIVIPDSVISIGDGAFAQCGALTNIVVEEGNPYYCSVENCLIETKSKTLIRGGKTSVIPDSIIAIGDYAFSGCSGISSLVINESVKSIGSAAFNACSGLTSVVIGDNVISIGDCAFMGCSKLRNIVIGNSVNEIGYWTFRDCDKLKSVTFSNPNGWYYYDDLNNRYALDGSDLRKSTTAANYLRSIYCDYDWGRSQ